AAWNKSVQDLTPQQAAWKAGPGRHSIWQIVNHMLYWREEGLRRAAGGAKPTEDEIKRMNFAEPEAVSDAAWRATLARLEDTQKRVAAALADENVNIERIVYYLPHDCYHFGQINLLRAMQGLKPIE